MANERWNTRPFIYFVVAYGVEVQSIAKYETSGYGHIWGAPEWTLTPDDFNNPSRWVASKSHPQRNKIGADFDNLWTTRVAPDREDADLVNYLNNNLKGNMNEIYASWEKGGSSAAYRMVVTAIVDSNVKTDLPFFAGLTNSGVVNPFNRIVGSASAVKVADKDKYQPTVTKVTKPETSPVTTDDVKNAVGTPRGARITNKEVKGNLPTTVGISTVPVEVTYADGSKESVNVPVEITRVADKDKYDPVVGNVTKPETTPITATDVTNVVTAPNGATITNKRVTGNIPTTVGTGTVPVEVTYADGTKETVNVPVEVTRVADKDKYQPAVTKVTKPETKPITATDVTNAVTAPNGATITNKRVTGNIPTTVGTGTVPVEVTYADGSKETVNVPVEVTRVADKDKYQPTVTKVTKPETSPVIEEDIKNAVGAPDGATITDEVVKGDVPTTVGTHPVPVEVTNAVTAPGGATITDKVVKGDIPTTVGTHPVPVEVTYADGSKETVNVPVEVTRVADKDKYNPTAPTTPIEKKEGELTEADVTGAVENKGDGTVTLKDGVELPTTPGTHNVPVVVTYPDHSTDELEVPVTIIAKTDA